MNRSSLICLCLLTLFGVATVRADESKPLPPIEARKEVGKKITVEMQVKSAKDRLEKHGEIYLDAEDNFKDPRNFAVVITRKGADSFKAAGIADPVAHFRGKTIRATGLVREVQKVPRIEVEDAAQIRLIEKKAP